MGRRGAAMDYMEQGMGNPRRRLPRDPKTGRFLPRSTRRRKRRRNSAVRIAAPKTMSRTQQLIGRNNPTSSGAGGDVVFHAQTRGGKYEIVVTRNGDEYRLAEYTRGRQSAASTGHTKASARREAERRVIDAKRYDGINYTVTLNALGSANPRRGKTPLKRSKGRSPQWWKISTYRNNGRLMGHHVGQGTKRQALEEARKKSEARGVAKAVLRGPFKTKPSSSR